MNRKRPKSKVDLTDNSKDTYCAFARSNQNNPKKSSKKGRISRTKEDERVFDRLVVHEGSPTGRENEEMMSKMTTYKVTADLFFPSPCSNSI